MDPTHDPLCSWHTMTDCFDPASDCWECAIITRTRSAMRDEHAGKNCAWPETCPNGPECLSCRKMDALTTQRYVGYQQGVDKTESMDKPASPCGHEYWEFTLDGTTRCSSCGADTTEMEAMGS